MFPRDAGDTAEAARSSPGPGQHKPHPYPQAARFWPRGEHTRGENTKDNRFSEKCLQFFTFFIQKKRGSLKRARSHLQEVPGSFFRKLSENRKMHRKEETL